MGKLAEILSWFWLHLLTVYSQCSESIWSKSGNRQPLADPEAKVPLHLIHHAVIPFVICEEHLIVTLIQVIPDSKRIKVSSEGDMLVQLIIYCVESFNVCHNGAFLFYSET